MKSKLEILDEKTMRCIRCGFCLEACPTFILTGQESDSPRGRIYLVRDSITNGKWSGGALNHIDACLGCRACETACPSGVEYGSILEMARAQISNQKSEPIVSRLKRKFVLSIATNSRLLSTLSKLLGGRTPIPRAELRQTFVAVFPPPTRRVHLLSGCAESVLFKTTHLAATVLLRLHGCDVVSTPTGQCCGALHKHQGFDKTAQQKESALCQERYENAPLITTSAGCGSSLKESTGGPDVYDICEFIQSIGFIPPQQPTTTRVAYMDACHLRHGQNITRAPRELLSSIPGVELVEIDDAGFCCGSAGIYSALHAKTSRELVKLKWDAIERTGARVVTAGNPGCLSWLEAERKRRRSTIEVKHTAVFLAECYLAESRRPST